MPVKALMRLDVVGWRATTIVASICLVWIVVSFIIGVSGPVRLNRSTAYAYQCPHNSHRWSSNCTGSQMGLGEVSPWFEVKTGHLDKTWHLMLTLFEKEAKGLEGRVRTFTEIQARSTSRPKEDWVQITKAHQKDIYLLCLGYGIQCVRNMMFWQSNNRYDLYRVRTYFQRDPDLALYIGDVEFEAAVTPDSYARVSLGFKHAYGLVTLGLTAFWFIYMLLFKRWPYSSWSWEQRYLSLMLIGLNLYNNPIYGVHLAASSAFFSWWNAFCEIAFIGFLLCVWLCYIARFRRAVKYENYLLDRQQQTTHIYHPAPSAPPVSSDDADDASLRRDDEPAQPTVIVTTTTREYAEDSLLEPPQPILDSDNLFTLRDIFYIGLSATYVALSSSLFLWSAIRDRMTPVVGIRDSTIGFQLFYYLAASFYTVLVILLAVQLSFNALGTRRHKDILWGRYVFFAGPTVLLAFALVLGLFTSNVGPFSTNLVGVLCFSALFNCYVFFALWAYWPIEGGYTAKDASESTSIFSDGPSYSSHL